MHLTAAPRAQTITILLFLTTAGCTGIYDTLPSVRQVPELAALERAGRAIPERAARVNAAGEGQRPLRLALHETGPGDRDRVVVMIHGLLSDSGVWRFVRPQLAGEYDLILVDLPGNGGSDAPRPLPRGSDWYAPRAMARSVLLALRQRLAGRPAGHKLTLVGHSLGGMLILRMLGDDQIREEFADVLGRVDGVVLVTPVDVAIEKDQPMFRELATVGALSVTLGDVTGILRERVAKSTRESVGQGAVAVKEEADRTAAVLRDPERRRAMQAIIRQAVPFRRKRPNWRQIEAITARYEQIDMRCLVLWGARDELFPMSMGYKVAAEVPNARLRIVPGAMHSLPTERPELCARLIRNFLTGADDARPRFAYLRTEALPIRARPQYLGARAQVK
jgi:pimeloyl-ACP methyl ester carboxylesterase